MNLQYLSLIPGFAAVAIVNHWLIETGRERIRAERVRREGERRQAMQSQWLLVGPEVGVDA